MKGIIYKITNNDNGKIYIGQTTNSFEERMRQHKDQANNLNNTNPLYCAIRKYGWDNFTKEILYCIDYDDIKELNELEVKMIEENNSLIDNGCGYNLKLGGANSGSHSEYTKKKISEAQLGEKNHMYGKTGSKSGSAKKIKNTTTNVVYESIIEAAQADGVNASKITAVCKGRRGSTGGYIYRYIDDKGSIMDPEFDAKKKEKKVLCVETGVIYNSIKEAKSQFPGNPDIGRVCNGERSKAAGYSWKYIEDGQE